MADYNEMKKIQVWMNGAQFVDSTHERQGYRKDKYGSWIKWSDYGNRNSQYGWEIDHIRPVVLGGSDNVDNLQPLHWKNNLTKSDDMTLGDILTGRFK